jgi:hypothetical protein
MMVCGRATANAALRDLYITYCGCVDRSFVEVQSSGFGVCRMEGLTNSGINLELARARQLRALAEIS